MSPEAKRTFEAEWTILARRLRALLGRKGIDPNLHDDLVQETALRLLSMWDGVDRRRPLWPLTVTIALNLLRDRGRQAGRDDLVADVPDLGTIHDVEAAGLARVELERVRRAMGELSTSQRSALMKEVGAHDRAGAPDASGDKMLRMRARRKLKLALENVSAVIGLRLRRIAEIFEGAFAIRDGAMSAASCMLCLMVAVGASIAPPEALTPPAAAHPAPSIDYLPALGNDTDAPTTLSAWTGAGATSEPRAGDVGSHGTAVNHRKAAVTKKAPGRSPSGAEQEKGLPGILPNDDDQVLPPPGEAVTVGATNEDPPSLHGGDSGDGTSLPSPPEPPAPPPLPVPPVNGAVPPTPVEEQAAELL